MKNNIKWKNKVITLNLFLLPTLLIWSFLASLNQVNLNSNFLLPNQAITYSEEIDYSSKIQTSINSSSLYIDENGQLYTFGNNSYGQLGVGEKRDENDNLINYSTPQKIIIGDNKKVSQAGFFSFFNSELSSAYAITQDGELYTWGYNEGNALGLDNKNSIIWTPQKVTFPNDEKVTKIEIGYSFDPNLISAIALTELGNVYVWGDNSENQLGLGNSFADQAEITTPQLLNIDNQQIVDISNSGQMQALTANGELYMWGYNDSGEVGVNTFDKYITTPTKVTFDTNTSSQIASADTNTYLSYAITKSGQLYAWGNNNQYSLANPNGNSNTPLLINLESDSNETIMVEEAFVAFESSYAITTNGNFYSWGKNAYGQVGNESTSEVITPYKVDIVSEQADNIQPIKTHYELATSSFAITDQGDLYTWGDNTNLQLGLTKGNSKILTPELVNLDNEKVVNADIGAHSFILTDQGNLYFFGNNDHGQLGNGDNSGQDQNNPVLIDNIFDSSAKSNSSLPAWAIALIVIFVIILLILICIGSWNFIQKRKEPKLVE